MTQRMNARPETFDLQDRARPRVTAQTPALAAERGPAWAAHLFLLSLLVPFHLPVGTLTLMPHRIVLLVLLVPFLMRLFVMRRAGPVLWADYLLMFSALWAGLALAINHGAGAIEPFGIHMVEFFGAYLVARVAIRTVHDFYRVGCTIFFMVLLLLPFAVLESVFSGPAMLDLLPNTSVRPIDTGDRLGLSRAQTIFAHPILYGVFVSTAFGLLLFVLRSPWAKTLSVPVTLLSTVFSLSTGALISIVAQISFIGWEVTLRGLRQRWQIFVGLSVLGYVAIDLLSNRTPFHVLVTYATFSTVSAYNRINIWIHGTKNVWENPVFGLGMNDWDRPVWMGSSIDNFWLLLAMRYGLPAIAMILVGLFLLLRRIWRQEVTDADARRMRAGYLVACGGLIIAGCTVHYWHAMMAFVTFTFGAGAWIGTGGGVSGRAEAADGPGAPSHDRYSRQLSRGDLRPVYSRFRTSRGAGRAPSRSSSART